MTAMPCSVTCYTYYKTTLNKLGNMRVPQSHEFKFNKRPLTDKRTSMQKHVLDVLVA